MIDLFQLPYPRHVHQGETSQIVTTADEARLALDDGWSLLPDGAEYDVPGAVHLPDDAPKTPKATKAPKTPKAD